MAGDRVLIVENDESYRGSTPLPPSLRELREEIRTALRSVREDHLARFAVRSEKSDLEEFADEIQSIESQVDKSLELALGIPSALETPRREEALANLRHDLVNCFYVIGETCEELMSECVSWRRDPELERVYTLAKYLHHLVADKLGERAAEEKPEETNPPAVPDPGPTVVSELPGARVLLVDDDPDILKILERKLLAVEPKLELLMTTDGDEALDWVENRDVDLVVLDIDMPKRNGIEVLRILRESYSRSRLPVVMATGRSDSEDIVRAFSAGANDYVTKPIDAPVLVSRLETQIALKKSSEQVLRRNLFIRSALGKYLTDDVVDHLLDSPGGMDFEGERRNVTVLFSDLRGFSALSDRVSPEEVVKILNHYFTAMVSVVNQYEGAVNEILGDALLVLFGAPTTRPDDADRAIACALAMQRAMASVNRTLRDWGCSELEMGIGLNTGEVVVGNIGAPDRRKYGVIGKHVNLASRVESCSVGGQVLVSEYTLKAASSPLDIGGRVRLEVKGFQEAIEIHDVAGISGTFTVRLPEEDERWVDLDAPVEVRFCLLEGKVTGEESFAGTFSRLRQKGAELVVRSGDKEIPPLTNLRIQVTGPDGETIGGDLYAKVSAGEKTGEGGYLLRFTEIPGAVSDLFADLLDK